MTYRRRTDSSNSIRPANAVPPRRPKSGRPCPDRAGLATRAKAAWHLFALVAGLALGAAAPASAAGLTVQPAGYAFGPTAIETGSDPVTFTVSNGGSEPVLLGTAALQRADDSPSPHFTLTSDNCSAQTLAAEADCTLAVRFQPEAAATSYSAVLAIPYAGGTEVLTAFLRNGESDLEQGERRLPPVVSALTLPDTLEVDGSYPLSWRLIGYGEKYRTRLVVFDCTVDTTDCGASYGNHALDSGLLEPTALTASDWSYGDARATQMQYDYTFSPAAADFPNAPNDLVLRLYYTSEADYLADKGSLSLVIPGGLVDGSSVTHADSAGRRLRTRLAADNTPVVTNPEPTLDADAGLTLSVDSLASVIDDGTFSLITIDGTPITPGASVTLASGATVSLDEAGNLTYTPPASAQALGAGETASDSFSYTVINADGDTAQGHISVTLRGVNDAPVALSPTPSLSEDATLALTLNGTLAGDVDANDTLTLSAIDGNAVTPNSSLTLASGATLAIDEVGNLSYTPAASAQTLAAGQSAGDSFTFTVADSAGASAQGTVSLTVTGVNDAPVAAPVARVVIEDVGDVLILDGLLASDVDSGDSLTLSAIDGNAVTPNSSLTLASGATLAIDAGGNLTYTPFQSLAAGEIGADSFTFTVADSAGAGAQGTVSLSVTGANDAPVALSPAPSLSEDDSLALTLNGTLGSDVDATDTLTLSAIDGNVVTPNSSLTLASGATVAIDAVGNLTYTPTAAAQTLADGQSAGDSFSYRVTDPAGASAQGTVSLTVTGVNDAPVAVADSATLPERLDGLLFHQYTGTLADLDALTGTPNMSGWSANLDVNTIFGKGLVFEGELQIDVAGDYTFHLSTDGVVYESQIPEEGTGDEFDTIERVVTTGEADLAIGGETLLAAGGSASVYLEAGRHPIRVRYLSTGSPRALSLQYESAGIGRQGLPNHALSTGHGILDLRANDSDIDAGDSLAISAVEGQPLSVDTPVTLASGARITLRADGRLAYDPSGAFAPLVGEATHSDTFSYTVVDSQGASAEADVAITLTGTDTIVPTLADGVALGYRPEPTRTLITLKNPTAETLSLDVVVSDTTDGSETERHRLELEPGVVASQYLDTIAYPDDSYPKLIPDINRRVDVVYRDGYRITGQTAAGPIGDDKWALLDILKSHITFTPMGSTYATSHFEVHNGNAIPVRIRFTIQGRRDEMTLAAGETRVMVEPYDVGVSLILYNSIYVSESADVLKLIPAFREQIHIEGTCRTDELSTFSVTNNSDEDIVLTVGADDRPASVSAGETTTFDALYTSSVPVKINQAILGTFSSNDERCGAQLDFTVESICTDLTFAYLSVTNNNTTTAYSIKLQSELVSSLDTEYTDINAGETKSFLIDPLGFDLRGTAGALYIHFGDEIVKGATFTFTDTPCY